MQPMPSNSPALGGSFPTPDASISAQFLHGYFCPWEQRVGKIEIVGILPSGGGLRASTFPNTGEGRERAVTYAMHLNESRNVYFGTCLRRSDAPDGRCSAKDFGGAPAIWLDLDEPGAAEAARAAWGACPPTVVVTTGSKPSLRLHAHWVLREIVEDAAETSRLVAMLIARFGGDPSVKDVARLMRLPGTVGHAKLGKKGRIDELVTFEITGAHAVSGAEMEAAFGGATRASPMPVGQLTGTSRHNPASSIVERLAATASGRNSALTAAAFALGGIMDRDGITVPEARAMLIAACERNGYAAKEPAKTLDVIERQLSLGRQRPLSDGQAGNTKASSSTLPEDSLDLFRFWQEIDFASIPRVEFVYASFYAIGYTSLTIAPPKVGKSLLGLVEAIDMATGRGLLTGYRTEPRRVIYYNAEDDDNVLKMRVAAVCRHYGIAQSEIVGRLAVRSGAAGDGIVFMRGQESTIVETAFEAMGRCIAATGATVLIFDPLQDLSESPETNESFRVLGKRLRHFAQEHKVALGLVHHTRKMQPGADRVSIEDSRGGGALRGVCRFNRALSPMTEDEGVKAGVDLHKRFFRISDSEGNLAPPESDVNRWFEKVSVELPNGASVGVACPWQWPDAFEGIDVSDAERVRQAVAMEPQGFGADVRCADWIGLRVGEELGFDASEKGAGRARAASIVKQWVSAGVLVARRVPNPRAGRDQARIFAGSEPVTTVDCR